MALLWDHSKEPLFGTFIFKTVRRYAPLADPELQVGNNHESAKNWSLFEENENFKLSSLYLQKSLYHFLIVFICIVFVFVETFCTFYGCRLLQKKNLNLQTALLRCFYLLISTITALNCSLTMHKYPKYRNTFLINKWHYHSFKESRSVFFYWGDVKFINTFDCILYIVWSWIDKK